MIVKKLKLDQETLKNLTEKGSACTLNSDVTFVVSCPTRCASCGSNCPPCP